MSASASEKQARRGTEKSRARGDGTMEKYGMMKETRKTLDDFDKFFLLMHCAQCAAANFAHNIALNEWNRVKEAHFSLRDRIIAKMDALNKEREQGKR